jgi:hypothetical protein
MIAELRTKILVKEMDRLAGVMIGIPYYQAFANVNPTFRSIVRLLHEPTAGVPLSLN